MRSTTAPFWIRAKHNAMSVKVFGGDITASAVRGYSGFGFDGSGLTYCRSGLLDRLGQSAAARRGRPLPWAIRRPGSASAYFGLRPLTISNAVLDLLGDRAAHAGANLMRSSSRIGASAAVPVKNSSSQM